MDEGTLVNWLVNEGDAKNVAAPAFQSSQSRLAVADEFEGGTFTISNLGMYGIKQFDAIINQPQCATWQSVALNNVCLSSRVKQLSLRLRIVQDNHVLIQVCVRHS